MNCTKTPTASRRILTAHEQGAAHAADGYARATRPHRRCAGHQRPWRDQPCHRHRHGLYGQRADGRLHRNVPTSLIGRDSFQEAYIEGITLPITKHNYPCAGSRIWRTRCARRSASPERAQGPVLVDIPKDVTANSCEFTHKPPELIRTVTRVDQQEAKAAAASSTKRSAPSVCFGGGVRSAAGCQPLRDLLTKAGIPATHTLMAAGVLSYGEPHKPGHARHARQLRRQQGRGGSRPRHRRRHRFSDPCGRSTPRTSAARPKSCRSTSTPARSARTSRSTWPSPATPPMCCRRSCLMWKD